MNLFDTLASVYTHGAYRIPDAPPSYVHDTAQVIRPPRASPLAALGKAWRQWRAARRNAGAAHALYRLDDRMLADIGVNRGDIPYLIAHGRVERPLNDNRRPEFASCG